MTASRSILGLCRIFPHQVQGTRHISGSTMLMSSLTLGELQAPRSIMPEDTNGVSTRALSLTRRQPSQIWLADDLTGYPRITPGQGVTHRRDESQSVPLDKVCSLCG